MLLRALPACRGARLAREQHADAEHANARDGRRTVQHEHEAEYEREEADDARHLGEAPQDEEREDEEERA